MCERFFGYAKLSHVPKADTFLIDNTRMHRPPGRRHNPDIREALDAFDEQTAKPTTVESIVGDLIGSFEGPGNLLSNPKHMAGYGR